MPDKPIKVKGKQIILDREKLNRVVLEIVEVLSKNHCTTCESGAAFGLIQFESGFRLADMEHLQEKIAEQEAKNGRTPTAN